MRCKTIYRVNQKQHSTGDSLILHPESVANVSLSHQAQRLHLLLLNQADDFRIYRENIAKRLNVSVRSIQRYINELKDAGLMLYHRRKMTMRADAGFYMVFELVPQRMHAIRERMKKAAKKVKKTAKKLLGQTVTLDDPRSLFDECIERLSQSNTLSIDDMNYLEMTFNDWYETLTAQPRPQDAYKWLARAHQLHLAEQQHTRELVKAKHRKSNELINLINCEASALRSRANTLKPQTTYERLTDRSWDDEKTL